MKHTTRLAAVAALMFMLITACQKVGISPTLKRSVPGRTYLLRIPVIYSYYNDGNGFYFSGSQSFMQELNATCGDPSRTEVITYNGTFNGFPGWPQPMACPTELSRLQSDIAHHAWDFFAGDDPSLSTLYFEVINGKDYISLITMAPAMYRTVTAIHCKLYW
jgi:hypothetical protein